MNEPKWEASITTASSLRGLQPLESPSAPPLRPPSDASTPHPDIMTTLRTGGDHASLEFATQNGPQDDQVRLCPPVTPGKINNEWEMSHAEEEGESSIVPVSAVENGKDQVERNV